MRVALGSDVFVTSAFLRRPLFESFEALCAFSGAHYKVVNLEQALGSSSSRVEKSTLYEGPWVAEALVKAGVNAVNLANNHIHDLGTEGIVRTKQILNAKGIVTVGAGATLSEAREPAYITADIALLGFCQFGKPYLRQIQVADAEPGINPLTEENVFYCLELLPESTKAILYFHWGREHVVFPPIEDIDLALRILKHPKVITIIGTHAHKLQGTVSSGRKTAFMSLGNFLFPNFVIEPDCHYSPNLPSGPKLPITYDYHRVHKPTLKRWRRVNRSSMFVVLDTVSRDLKTEFALQDAGRPVLRTPRPLVMWTLEARMRILGWCYRSLSRPVYRLLADVQHGHNQLRRRLKFYRLLLSEHGFIWLFRKVAKRALSTRG